MMIKNRANRIIVLIIGVLLIIIQIGSLATGTNSSHYVFCTFIEISTLLLIIFKAWRWTELRTYNKSSTKAL